MSLTCFPEVHATKTSCVGCFRSSGELHASGGALASRLLILESSVFVVFQSGSSCVRFVSSSSFKETWIANHGGQVKALPAYIKALTATTRDPSKNIQYSCQRSFLTTTTCACQATQRVANKNSSESYEHLHIAGIL